MIQRLDSSKCSTRSSELSEGQTPKIIPLNSQTQSSTKTESVEDGIKEDKKVDIREYIEAQNNLVVAFLIKWIRGTYTKELLGYLMKDFKNQIETDILEKLNNKQQTICN